MWRSSVAAQKIADDFAAKSADNVCDLPTRRDAETLP
jgi:hypothetical protein